MILTPGVQFSRSGRRLVRAHQLEEPFEALYKVQIPFKTTLS